MTTNPRLDYSIETLNQRVAGSSPARLTIIFNPTNELARTFPIEAVLTSISRSADKCNPRLTLESTS